MCSIVFEWGGINDIQTDNKHINYSFNKCYITEFDLCVRHCKEVTTI